MNSLVEALIEGIISEYKQSKKKIVGMFGGVLNHVRQAI